MSLSFSSPLTGFGASSGFMSPGLGMGVPGRFGMSSPFSAEGSNVSSEALQEAGAAAIMLLIMMLLGELEQQQQGNQGGGGDPFSSMSPYLGGSSPIGGGGGGGGVSAEPNSGSSASTPTGTANPNAANNVSASGPINNPSDFATQLLKSLGDPVTSANVNSLVNWQNKEGGNWHNTAHYNPLNTTQQMAGSTGMNGVGVQAYTSWNEGLQATVKSLNNGDYNDILGALKSGQGLGNGTYKGLSTWSGGGYSSV